MRIEMVKTKAPTRMVALVHGAGSKEEVRRIAVKNSLDFRSIHPYSGPDDEADCWLIYGNRSDEMMEIWLKD